MNDAIWNNVSQLSSFSQAAFEKTTETFGGIDILCNNAGILNEGLWEQTVSINLVRSRKKNTDCIWLGLSQLLVHGCNTPTREITQHSWFKAKLINHWRHRGCKMKLWLGLHFCFLFFQQWWTWYAESSQHVFTDRKLDFCWQIFHVVGGSYQGDLPGFWAHEQIERRPGRGHHQHSIYGR